MGLEDLLEIKHYLLGLSGTFHCLLVLVDNYGYVVFMVFNNPIGVTPPLPLFLYVLLFWAWLKNRGQYIFLTSTIEQYQR